jgi:hypothetical protein
VVHAHAPFRHEQLLHPSPAGIVSPLVHAGGGHARSVQAQPSSEHVQLLQPSSAVLVSPGLQTGPASMHSPDVPHSGPPLPCVAVLPEQASKPTGTHINHQIRDAIIDE